MLAIEIINQMDIEELRNYCMHLISLVESSEDLIGSQVELLEAFKNLYNAENFRHDRSELLKVEREKILAVEQYLSKKYESYLPRPVCD